jgi:hypothetical protein
MLVCSECCFYPQVVTQCCGGLLCDISDNVAVSIFRPNECTCVCFNDAASVSGFVTSDRWMIRNTGLCGLQKGAVAAQFKVLCRYSPGDSVRD